MVEQVPLEHLEAQITELAGQRSAATCRWLLCGVSSPAAREHVRVGRALDGLPLVTAAFASGTLSSYSKVRAVTRVATPATEQNLLEFARHATAAQLDRIVAGRKTVDRNEARELTAAPDLTACHDDDGSLVGSFRLDPEEGAALLAALTRGKDLLRSRPRPTRWKKKALPRECPGSPTPTPLPS